VLQRVVRSTVIERPIEEVWEVLRDFNRHDQWHGLVSRSTIESGLRASQVGCVRAFSLRDGGFVREQLLGLDDRNFRSTYCILEATLPLERYVATVTLKAVTDRRHTFWHWSSTFGCPRGEELALCKVVGDEVYEAGFADLRRYLSRSRALARGAAGDRGAAGAGAQGAGSIAEPAVQTIELERYGDARQLRPQTRRLQPPGPREVRLRQTAIGVNFIDIYLRRGWIPEMLAPGAVPGMEAAGEVVALGTEVTGLQEGDRVAYMGPVPGAYASARNVPRDWLVRLPPSVEEEMAAALLLKGITADYLLHDLGRVRQGARWLVHAAAGGVGSILCQWGARLGARIVGTVSSQEKARQARNWGCEHVIVTSEYRFAESLRYHFPDGAEVIVDGLGAAAAGENFQALADCGHWISLGQASGGLEPLAPDLLVRKSASFSRPVAFAYVATREALEMRAERLWSALEAKSFRRPPIERFALAQAAEAHLRLESRASTGSIVLLP